MELGEKNGFRNAQATVLAPTGTIAFMMDCETTGIEPDIALVKYKVLAGGGMLKIINRAARRGLAAAEEQGDDFTANEIREAMAFKLEEKSIKFEPPISKSVNQQPGASGNVGRFKVEVVE